MSQLRRMLVVLAACHSAEVAGEPAKVALAKVSEVCVTKGELAKRSIAVPAIRGFGRATTGEAARLEFTYRGPTEQVSELASGDVRSQIGLKLRAADGCNLIYVMWRVEPKPGIVVQVKRNIGQTTHEQCGANGYTRIKAAKSKKVQAPEVGSTHTLNAQIDGDDLTVWADNRVVWQGALPDTARDLKGPAGFRADNVIADIELYGVVNDDKSPCPKPKGDAD